MKRSITADPLVSVIIIFLNGERFLREAIESVVAQAYTNWELLLVDDGSANESTRIAQEYVTRFPGRICYREHPGHLNRGMSASRNLGIRHARGDYISFLDADDVWLPEKLRQQVSLMEAHPEAAMVYGPSAWWYSWNVNAAPLRSDFIQNLSMRPGTLVHPPALLALFLKDEEAIPLPSNIMVRKKSVNEVGGFEEAFRGMYEDQAFLAKACLRFPAFIAGECWLKYRQHQDGCCSVASRSGRANAARVMYLKWLARYLSGQGVGNDEIRELVRGELRKCSPPLAHRVVKKLKSVKEHLRLCRKPVGKACED